jgi:signal peptidase I
MLEKIKKYWKIATEGWQGYITYAILGIFLAYVVNFILGYFLSTDLPLVAVVSGSMSHKPENNLICGKYALNYQNNINDYWNYCGETFIYFNITKYEFMSFPFNNGLEVGDVAVIKGEKEYKVGDIIVYSPLNSKYPIIHRIVYINQDGTYQTKGDHNSGQLSYEKRIEKNQIHGKVIFVIPYIGWIKVLFVRLIGL